MHRDQVNEWRKVVLLLNVVVILWCVAGYYWAANWYGIFPDRQACTEAIIAAKQDAPWTTEIDTPDACRGLSTADHMEIVASIPWLELFPNMPRGEDGLGVAPEPTRTTTRAPKPRPTPTTERPSPTPSASPSPDETLPSSPDEPPTTDPSPSDTESSPVEEDPISPPPPADDPVDGEPVPDAP